MAGDAPRRPDIDDGRLAAAEIGGVEAVDGAGAGVQAFDRRQVEFGDRLADQRRGQLGRVAAMKREPEQAGEAGEDDQWQREAPLSPRRFRLPARSWFRLSRPRRLGWRRFRLRGGGGLPRGRGLGRAPREPLTLELGDQTALAPIVADDDHHECRDGDQGDAIGGPDEGGVRSEVGHLGFGYAAAARSTCIWRSACTRRRRISARMAIKCRSTNSSVKPAAMTNSGVSSDGSMVGPPTRKMLAG